MADSSSVVYALDFDGVVCDSVGESAQTALRAAAKVWPHLPIAEPFPLAWIKALRQVRPVIETGFENVLLARLVAQSTSDDTVEQQFVQPILADWASMRESVMQQWDVSRSELIEVFGSVRDDWIDRDIDSWIDANRMYVLLASISFFLIWLAFLFLYVPSETILTDLLCVLSCFAPL